MLLKDLKRIEPELSERMEVYRFHGTDEAHYRGDFHGDSLRSVYDDEIKDTDKVHSYEVMDKERYMETILANACIEETWIDEDEFPILVVILRDDEDDEHAEEDE